MEGHSNGSFIGEGGQQGVYRVYSAHSHLSTEAENLVSSFFFAFHHFLPEDCGSLDIPIDRT